MKKVIVVNKLTNRQAVQDIKDDLNSVFPNSDGEAIALEIAKHVFDIFYDDIDNAVSASHHDSNLHKRIFAGKRRPFFNASMKQGTVSVI